MAKRTEFLIVDGYNIIFAWDFLKEKAGDSLEDARLALIDTLRDFQGASGIEVILVFDAHKVKQNPGALEHHDNITVIYTKEAQTADEYIERTASLLSGDYRVRVATSDYLEQIITLSHGALRVSAAGLLEEINSMKKHLRERFISKKGVKLNTILDNVDLETARKLEQMRRG